MYMNRESKRGFFSAYNNIVYTFFTGFELNFKVDLQEYILSVKPSSTDYTAIISNTDACFSHYTLFIRYLHFLYQNHDIEILNCKRAISA